jgi:hypothetical protein
MHCGNMRAHICMCIGCIQGRQAKISATCVTSSGWDMPLTRLEHKLLITHIEHNHKDTCAHGLHKHVETHQP